MVQYFRKNEMNGPTAEGTCTKSLTRSGTGYMLMTRLEKKMYEITY
jgi:hypothetical protein